ncbi:MAG: hypothetical protein ACRC5C_04935 [Bacilli bacterium]
MNLIKWKGLDIDPMRINESFDSTMKVSRVDVNLNESTSEQSQIIYPQIEAIHAGVTKNSNRYLAEKLKGDPELKSGVYSWTHPYGKPVIFNHDVNTECTGRVYSASYTELTQKGAPGIIVTPKITSPEAVQAIKDGRLLTVSIGATTNACVCSICRTDIVNEGFCGHYRGEQYDDQTCEWIAGDLFFDELSWVNVPADDGAMVVGEFTPHTNSVLTHESVVVTSKDVSEKMTEKEETDVDKENQTVEEQEATLPVVEDEQQATEPEVVATEEEATTEEETEVEAEVTEQEDAEVNEDAEAEAVKESEDKTDENTQEEPAEEEKELKSLQDEVEQLKNENEVLKQEIEALKSENQQEKTANEELSKEYRETVLDLVKRSKTRVAEAADMEKYEGRSLQSLKDSLIDFFDEKALDKTNARNVEKVDKPLGTKTTESTEQKPVQKITKEQALLSLLGHKIN